VSAHAGIVLLPNEATPAATGSALQQVLTDRSIRAAAQDIAEEIAAMDSPDDVIEKLHRQFAVGIRNYSARPRRLFAE
jgi:UDP:flavonoid glycosyltransferase YjiC (YdhE family)